MADSWLLTLIFKTDSKTKELVWNIQIESRWFVYSSEVQKIHTWIVNFAKRRYTTLSKNNKNMKEIMKTIKNDLWSYLLKEIWREPMIIPMFVYINKDWSIDKTSHHNEKEDIIWMTLEEQWWI
jgi:mRNA degradation ribonuclease J1/J2